MTGKTAIVIGASMAGLLAARVLSEHFDRVLVIDRDTLPDGPEVRSGVPQGRHIHALLSAGQDLLERLFPGLTNELTQSGSPRMTWCRDTCYFTPGGWIKRFDSKLHTNVITRPDLEYRIRRRVAADPRVTFLTGREVSGLTATPDKSTVTGVEVSVRGIDAVEQHTADLIVDASGRGSKAPEWLEALGYPAPAETTVNSHVGYATRVYEKPAQGTDWKILFINARSAENNPRGGAIFDIGGGQWMVSLGGMNKVYPPTDEKGFDAFARLLPSPTLAEALQTAKPLTAITGYRIPGSRQRHYEKLARRPENFILIGDSVCAFNPIYGQGITVAAMEAVELGKMLERRGTRNLTGFAQAFQARIANTLRNAWLLSTGEDLRFPGTEGDRPNAATRLIQRYVDQYAKVSYDDELLTLVFIRVLNLAASPASLFAPRIVWRVLSRTLRGAGDPSGAANAALIPAVQTNS
jgi:2-polyprenyl-6-methoxyphenol hydroxylase-like FAD-dependent oxidoreductase